MEPLHRVGTVQGLVEHEHLRVRDEGGCDLRALPHPLAESTDPAVRDVGETDSLDGPIDRTRICDPVKVRDVADELASGEDGGHRFVLGQGRPGFLESLRVEVVDRNPYEPVVRGHDIALTGGPD